MTDLSQLPGLPWPLSRVAYRSGGAAGAGADGADGAPAGADGAGASRSTRRRGADEVSVVVDGGRVIVSGPRLEVVLATITARLGADAQLSQCERDIVGGLGGFFGRERFTVVATPGASGTPVTGGTVPGGTADPVEPVRLEPEAPSPDADVSPVDGSWSGSAFADALTRAMTDLDPDGGAPGDVAPSPASFTRSMADALAELRGEDSVELTSLTGPASISTDDTDDTDDADVLVVDHEMLVADEADTLAAAAAPLVESIPEDDPEPAPSATGPERAEAILAALADLDPADALAPAGADTARALAEAVELVLSDPTGPAEPATLALDLAPLVESRESAAAPAVAAPARPVVDTPSFALGLVSVLSGLDATAPAPRVTVRTTPSPTLAEGLVALLSGLGPTSTAAVDTTSAVPAPSVAPAPRRTSGLRPPPPTVELTSDRDLASENAADAPAARATPRATALRPPAPPERARTGPPERPQVAPHPPTPAERSPDRTRADTALRTEHHRTTPSPRAAPRRRARWKGRDGPSLDPPDPSIRAAVLSLDAAIATLAAQAAREARVSVWQRQLRSATSARGSTGSDPPTDVPAPGNAVDPPDPSAPLPAARPGGRARRHPSRRLSLVPPDLGDDAPGVTVIAAPEVPDVATTRTRTPRPRRKAI